VPFDFLRILLEDKYVERVERKKLAELIGERVRQFLKLPACRKGRLCEAPLRSAACWFPAE